MPSSMTEVNPVEIVRTEKSLGCGTFVACYVAYYRTSLLHLKARMKSKSVYEVKNALLHEERMINHLGSNTRRAVTVGNTVQRRKRRKCNTVNGL